MAKRTFKKTQTLSGGKKVYRKWDEYEVGDVLIGKYVAIHTDQYKKECPVVEVLEAQFKDDSGDDLEGQQLVLNACGMLNKALEDVAFGQLIQVTYNGKSTIEKGPYKDKEAHTMSVDIVELDEEEPDL